MQDGNSQIRVATDGNVACQWRAWRHQGASWLTVVAKASFTMTPGGAVVPTSPLDVVLDDRTFGKNPTRSVEAAAEGAPFLAKCDVLLTGHAHGAGRGAAAVRLAVYRDQVAIVDRTAHVFGERDAAGAPRVFDRLPLVYERAWGGPGVDANPVGSDRPSIVDPSDPKKPVCFAPISRFWAARKRLLAQLDVAALFGAPGPLASVPDGLSWAYFQSAPPEQQVEYLRGDEWIVLDGVSASLPRVQTRLMGARAVARVRLPGGEVQAPLVADMLVIDADRLTCSIVWRGRAALGAVAPALSDVAVGAALDMPDRPIAWDRIWSQLRGVVAAPGPERAALPRDPAPAGEVTLGIGADEQQAASLRAVAPFSVPGSRPASGQKGSSATPWAGREQGASAPASLSGPGVAPAGGLALAAAAGLAGEATLAASADAVGESTLGLSATEQAARSVQPVAPFSVRAPGSSAPASLAATPWSGEAPASVPVAAVGEATLDLASSRVAPPASVPVAVAPPAMLPVVAPPAMMPVAPAAPAPVPVASVPVGSVPVGSVPVGSVPVGSVPVGSVPFAAPPRATVAAPPPAPKALSLQERLLAAGAGGDDIAALMLALSPPAPPPLSEDD